MALMKAKKIKVPPEKSSTISHNPISDSKVRKTTKVLKKVTLFFSFDPKTTESS